MATGVETGIAEATRELQTLTPESEGLDDLERLNIGSAALEEVEISRTEYARRMRLIEAYIAAGEALLRDGYPGLKARGVPALILAKLQDQAVTIEAALKKFTPNSMVSLGQTFGDPEPKD